MASQLTNLPEKNFIYQKIDTLYVLKRVLILVPFVILSLSLLSFSASASDFQPSKNNNILYLHTKMDSAIYSRWMNAEQNDPESNTHAERFQAQGTKSRIVFEYEENPELNETFQLNSKMNIKASFNIEIYTGSVEDGIDCTLYSGDVIVGKGSDNESQNDKWVMEFVPKVREISKNLKLVLEFNLTGAEANGEIYTDGTSNISLRYQTKSQLLQT